MQQGLSHLAHLALWRHNTAGHMNAFLVASMLVISISFAPVAMATMSQADCQAIWNNADANSDGKVDGLEAKPFIDAMIAANEKSIDSKGTSLQSSEFLKSCQAGTFDSAKL
jgi:hypothetical protein